MYECMHVWMYVCMYACMHVCMHAYVHVCMYVCMYVCIYVCVLLVCMHVCVHACMCVRMYACMYVCKHACVCVAYLCIHVSFHAPTSPHLATTASFPNRYTSVSPYLHLYTSYQPRHVNFFLMYTFHITPFSKAVVQLDFRHSLKIIQ